MYCSPAPDAAFRFNPDEYPGAEWVGKDHQGRLVFYRAGILYRLLSNKEVLVRDFNPDIPPPIAA
jgi:hypothetical protein